MSNRRTRIDLLDAIERGDADAIHSILQVEPNIIREVVGVNGQTPLQVAATAPAAVTKVMLAFGADPNIDNTGYTPLFDAIRQGPLETVKLLIEHGADVNYRTRSGTTPLYYASTSRRHDRDQAVELLIQSGAIWDLHSALSMKRYDLSRNLLEQGCAALVKAPLSSEVLATAVLTDAPVDIVRKLLECGAPPNGDPSGVAPLVSLLGHSNCNREFIQLLLQHGADPNARTPAGVTALRHYRNNFDDQAVIELLVQYGAHE